MKRELPTFSNKDPYNCNRQCPHFRGEKFNGGNPVYVCEIYGIYAKVMIQGSSKPFGGEPVRRAHQCIEDYSLDTQIIKLCEELPTPR
jgi:hypothetical protein